MSQLNPQARRDYMNKYRQDIRRYLFVGAKARAKKCHIEFTIKIEDIIVPQFCPILGMELKRNVGSRTAQDNSPSVDRIDSQKGYIPGNIQVVSYRANTLKNSGSAAEHRRIAEWLESRLQ